MYSSEKTSNISILVALQPCLRFLFRRVFFRYSLNVDLLILKLCERKFRNFAIFIHETYEDMSFAVFENDSAIQGGGAGIQAAQFLALQGVDAVITGNCGQKQTNYPGVKNHSKDFFLR